MCYFFVLPYDWHLHLRDGAMLAAVAPYTARDFARAIVMPNLVPPVRTGADAAAYAARIRAAVPDGADFTPLMTLYLTETTDPDDIEAAHTAGIITARSSGASEARGRRRDEPAIRTWRRRRHQRRVALGRRRHSRRL